VWGGCGLTGRSAFGTPFQPSVVKARQQFKRTSVSVWRQIATRNKQPEQSSGKRRQTLGCDWVLRSRTHTGPVLNRAKPRAEPPTLAGSSDIVVEAVPVERRPDSAVPDRVNVLLPCSIRAWRGQSRAERRKLWLGGEFCVNSSFLGLCAEYTDLDSLHKVHIIGIDGKVGNLGDTGKPSRLTFCQASHGGLGTSGDLCGQGSRKSRFD
jgi:hypothetical protein